MTKAALHYHFPGKAELGRALIERYTERFAAALADIDGRIPDAPAKLDAYAGLYADGRRAGTIALVGPASDAARLIVSGLEGAMLVARPYGDVARFDTAAEGLLASFGAPSPARPATSGQDG